MSGIVRRAASVLFCLTIGSLVAAPAAHAQLPDLPATPATPELPQPVVDAISQSVDLLVPVLLQASDAAGPAVTAAGFALRPECSAVALPLFLVVAVAGGSVPFSPGAVLTPYYVSCGHASETGPVDGVFGQVDSAAGAQLQAAVQPILDQLHDAVITPIRPSLNQACGAMAAVGTAPNQVPAPLNRFDLTKVLCDT